MRRSVIGAGETEPAVVIRIRNAVDVIKEKGGSLAAFAASLAPETIKSRMYSQIKDQLVQKFKDQGVDADVQVVAPPNGPAFHGELLTGALIGGGLVGLSWVLSRYVGRKRRR